MENKMRRTQSIYKGEGQPMPIDHNQMTVEVMKEQVYAAITAGDTSVFLLHSDIIMKFVEPNQKNWIPFKIKK
jgi:isocitrate dehydrogenase